MKYITQNDVMKTYKPQNLMSPPGAQTDSSIALIWDKPEDSEELKYYKIFMDGQLAGEVHSTDFTVEKLVPGTEYTYKVCTVLSNGDLSEESSEITVSTMPQAQIFDITRYGAVGDGKTLNTGAIQKAIDECIPGGCVYFPEGVFLSGALNLKSDMTLYISKDSTLLGSDSTKDYPLILCRYQGEENECYSSLINGGTIKNGGLRNVRITGGGRIDGNGSKLRYQEEVVENKGFRGRVICFRNSESIYLYDITVAQPPAWCIHFIYCKNVCVNSLKLYILTDENGNLYEGIHNGDGINPDSSSNVYIFNTMIAGQDNCIAIKSGKDEEGRRIGIPSENIRVSNCLFTSGGGVAVGSEMSGGVKNVLIRDCVFENAKTMATIKATRGRGSVAENIRFEDIRYINTSSKETLKPNKWNKGIINIDHFYGYDESEPTIKQPFNEGTPVFKDISFKNISIKSEVKFAIYMTAVPESPLKNIRLENVKAEGLYGFIANNIDGLELKNVSVKAYEGEDYVLQNVDFK